MAVNIERIQEILERELPFVFEEGGTYWRERTELRLAKAPFVDAEGALRVCFLRVFTVSEHDPDYPDEPPRVTEAPLEVILAFDAMALDLERFATFWSVSAHCARLIYMKAPLAECFDATVLDDSKLERERDFQWALLDSKSVGRHLPRGTFDAPLDDELRAEIEACFPMSGGVMELEIVPKFGEETTWSYDTPVLRGGRELVVTLRTIVWDGAGAERSVRDIKEQVVTLAKNSAHDDPARLLEGVRAHRAVLERALGNPSTDIDVLMPYDLIYPDIYDLKRASTQDDFERALSKRSRLGKWLRPNDRSS